MQIFPEASKFLNIIASHIRSSVLSHITSAPDRSHYLGAKSLSASIFSSHFVSVSWNIMNFWQCTVMELSHYMWPKISLVNKTRTRKTLMNLIMVMQQNLLQYNEILFLVPTRTHHKKLKVNNLISRHSNTATNRITRDKRSMWQTIPLQ